MKRALPTLGALLGLMFLCASAMAQQQQQQAPPEPRPAAAQQAAQDTQTGQFQAIRQNQLAVTINGEQRFFVVSPEAQVVINGQPARLTDLRPGDQIAVRLGPNQTAIQVAVRRGNQAAQQQPGQPGAEQPAQPRAEQPAQRPEQQPRQQPDQRPGQQSDQRPDQRPGQQPQRQPGQQPQDSAAQQQPRLEEGVRLGVLLAPAPSGTLIQDVRPGSPADHARLQPGDYLLSIGDTKIDREEAVMQALSQFNEGDTAQVVIWRNGEQRTVEVTFDPRFQRAFRQEFPETAPGSQEQGDQRETAWLGVTMRRFAPEPLPGQPQAEQQVQGVHLLRVYPSGPAARAGLRSGDIVVQAGDQRVERPEDLADAVSQREPGDTIELTVVRNGEQHRVTAQLGSLAAFFGDSDSQTPQPFLGDFQHDDVSEHAMMLEQNRRFAEQHQRLEELVLKLHDEVRALRQELRGVRPDEQPAPEGQTPQTRPGAGTPREPGAAPALPRPNQGNQGAPDNRGTPDNREN